MKCFVAILLLAIVAVVMAVEKTPESIKKPETIDAARDKRGLGYGLSPYAYGGYPYNSYYSGYPGYSGYSGYYPGYTGYSGYYPGYYRHYPSYYNQYPYHHY